MSLVQGLSGAALRPGWWRVLLGRPKEQACELIAAQDAEWRRDAGLESLPAGGWSRARSSEIAAQPVKWGLVELGTDQLTPLGRVFLALAPWTEGQNPHLWSEEARLGALLVLFQSHGDLLVPLLRDWPSLGVMNKEELEQRGMRVLEELAPSSEAARHLAELQRGRDPQQRRLQFLWPSLEPLRELGILRSYADSARSGVFGGYELTERGFRLVQALRRYGEPPNFPISGLAQLWLEVEGVSPGAPASAEQLLRLALDLPPQLWVSEQEQSLAVFPWMVQARLFRLHPGVWTDPASAHAQLKALQIAHPGLVELRSGQEQGELPNLFIADPRGLRGLLGAPPPGPPEQPAPSSSPEEPASIPDGGCASVDEDAGAGELESGPSEVPLNPERVRAWLGLALAMASEGHRADALAALAPPHLHLICQELDQLLLRCPEERLARWRLRKHHPLMGDDCVMERRGGLRPPKESSIDDRPRGEPQASALRGLERWIEASPRGLDPADRERWSAFLARWGSLEERREQLRSDLDLLRSGLERSDPAGESSLRQATMALRGWLEQPERPTSLPLEVVQWTASWWVQACERDIGHRERVIEGSLRGLGAVLDEPDTADAASSAALALLHEEASRASTEWGVRVYLKGDPGAMERWEEVWKTEIRPRLDFDGHPRYHRLADDWERGTDSPGALERLWTVQREGASASAAQVEMELRDWLRGRAAGLDGVSLGGLPLAPLQGLHLELREGKGAPPFAEAEVRRLQPGLFTRVEAQAASRPGAHRGDFRRAALRLAHQELLQDVADGFWADRLSQLWTAMEGVYLATTGRSEERERERLLSALVLHAWMGGRWSWAARAVLGLSAEAAVAAGQVGDDLEVILRRVGPSALAEVQRRAKLPGAARRALQGGAWLKLTSLEELGRCLVSQHPQWMALCEAVSDPAHLVFASALRPLLLAIGDPKKHEDLARDELRPAWLDAVAMVQRHYALRNRIAHDGLGHELADQPALRRLTCSLLPLYRWGLLQLAAAPDGAEPWQGALRDVRILARTRPSPVRKGSPPLQELTEELMGELFRAEALRESLGQGRSQT